MAASNPVPLRMLFMATLLASGGACAQPAASQPSASSEPAATATALTPAVASQPPALVTPQQSPITGPATSLVTVEHTAALTSAVAGTCTVIDALLMDICAQTPNDDYCRR